MLSGLFSELDPALWNAEAICGGAFMLGLLHLDGDATGGADPAEAVRWLRIAAESGSREAPAMLGTLFNTGQYG